MIYILQFSETIGNKQNPRGMARYYIGYCEDDRLEERINEHRTGMGSAITRAVVNRGLKLSVVMTMPGDRNKERKLKNQKNTPRIVKQYMEKVNHAPRNCS